MERSKKKKVIKNNSTPDQRHFGVIMEDIDSKIDLLVEGHQALDKKVDTLDRKVDTLDQKVGMLDQKIDRHHEEFQEFRKEMNYKFEITFDELHLIHNELKEKVGRDEFILLEKRVAVLERNR